MTILDNFENNVKEKKKRKTNEYTEISFDSDIISQAQAAPFSISGIFRLCLLQNVALSLKIRWVLLVCHHSFLSIFFERLVY